MTTCLGVVSDIIGEAVVECIVKPQKLAVFVYIDHDISVLQQMQQAWDTRQRNSMLRDRRKRPSERYHRIQRRRTEE